MPNLERIQREPVGGGVLETIRLSDAERELYIAALKKAGIWYEPYAGVPGKEGMVLPYADPLIIKRELAEKLIKAAAAFRSIGRDRILSTEIYEITKDRAPHIDGIKLASNDVTSQLVENVENGMSLPINYDTILAQEDGQIVPKAVEIQLAASAYVGWFDVLTKCAVTAKPDLLDKYRTSKGDPVKSLGSLKKMVGGEDIDVIDFDPISGPTSADVYAMANILGNENSVPASISDLRRAVDGGWEIGLRDRNTKEIVGYKRLKNVLSRSLQGDIDGCLKFWKSTLPEEEYLQKKRMLQDFFLETDRTKINWIWHPSFQEIINKKDLGLLSTREETKRMETKTYVAGEQVKGPGKFFYKFLGGNSGKGVNFMKLQDGQEFVVEADHVLQEAINIAPIKMPVIDPKTGKETFMICTVEIRTMPPFNYQEDPKDVNTFFFSRINFRRVLNIEKPYLKGDTVDAPGEYWLEDLKTGEMVRIVLDAGDKSVIPEGYKAWQVYGDLAKTNVGEIMLNMGRLAQSQGLTFEQVMAYTLSIGQPSVFIEK